MPDPVWGGVVVTFITGVVTAWVTLRSKKVEAQGSLMAQLREDRQQAAKERSEALEALEAARAELFQERAKSLDYERLRRDVTELQRQREADHKRIQCLELKLTRTKSLLAEAADHISILHRWSESGAAPPPPTIPPEIKKYLDELR